MRNKRLNQKGFTLIEVIATVAILAILSVVAGISVNKIIQNSKEEHYHSAESNMEMAGQSYVQQNRNALPKTIGQKTKIPLNQLENKNYIESIKDYSGTKCDSEKSYVQIFKYSQNDYSYRAYLDCGTAYKSDANGTKPEPKIETAVTGTNGNEKPQIKVKITDSNKLISWSYQIFRYGKEVKNSGSIALPNYDTQLNKTIDLKEYTPGKLKIVITATNIYGFTAQTTVNESETNFKDETGPECVIADADLDTVKKPWTKEPVKITIKCDDKNGSGCEREEYTKTFKSSTRIGTIKIKDLAGNTTSCKVAVFMDITKPTIKLVAYKRNANGTKGSKIEEIVVDNSASDKTLDLSTKSTTKWLNNSYSANGLYYEVKYTDGESEVQYDVKQNNPGLLPTEPSVNTLVDLENGTTPLAGETKKYETIEDGHRIYTITARDEVGNASTLKVIAPLDRVAPSKPVITNPSNQVWVKSDFPLTLVSNDTLSGIESFQYTFKNGATSVTGNNTTGYVKYPNSSAGKNVTKTYQTPNYTTEGNFVSYNRVCDVAGNCSGTENTKIMLDKTPPTKPSLTITGQSTLTVVMKSTDAHSGISHFEYRPINSGGAFTKFPETGKGQITITTSQSIEIRAVDKVGNASATSLTKHCNTSGGTLTNDSSKGYICVKSTIQVSSTCSGTCSGTCFRNVPCSGGWQSNGWAGNTTYCSIPYDCSYSCSKPCTVTGCPSGFTLDGSRCIKAADGA